MLGVAHFCESYAHKASQFLESAAVRESIRGWSKKACPCYQGGNAMPVKYPIITEKTAMLVVDMQNEFVQEGALREKLPARAMVPRLNQLLDVCRAHKILVIYIHMVIRG